MKRTLALLLCVLMGLGLFAGCSVNRNTQNPPKEPEELRRAIEAELDCEIRKDESGAYALFYPNAVDRNTFHQVFTQSQSYFPVQKDYTLTMQEFDEYKGINVEKSYVTAWYLIETGGEKYYLFVNRTSDDGGSGFKQWNIMNESDYKTWQESQKK